MKLRHSILISLATSIVLSLSLTSCDKDKPIKDYEYPNNSIQDKDDSEAITIKKDSLESLQTKIEELSQQNEDSSDDIKNLQSSVKDLDGLRFWMWISLGLGGLAILLSIIAMGKSSSSKGAVEDIEKSLRKIKLKLQNDTHQPQQVSRNSSSNEVEQLKRRVWNLENQLRQLSAALTLDRPTPPVPEPIVPTPQQQEKTGFFCLPVRAQEPYFKKFLTSKEPEARLQAVIFKQKALFKPFESDQFLDAYLSSDAIRVAVEFTGDTMHPTSMKIIEEGEAIFKGERWYITKKAIVKLS